MKPAHPTTQARADAARTAPFWPFAPLTCPVQQRHHSAFQRALQAGTLAAAALALPQSLAQAFEWREIMTTDAGASWALRTGTVALRIRGQATEVVAVVKRADASGEALYVAHVNRDHCNRPRGDMGLSTLDGMPVAAVVFVAGTATAPAVMAAALCAEVKRGSA